MAIGTGAALLGASALGGLSSAIGANKAAKTQANAANRATDVQLQMFNQSRADQMPWMNAGEGGLNALMQLYGFERNGDSWGLSSNPAATSNAAMRMDPGYLFRLSQGQQALENSAAARGGLLSGNALRGVTEFGQNFASNEFGNVANRLAALAGFGQSTGQNLGALGANTASNVGNNMMNAGAARASGYTGMSNAFNGMLNNGIGLYGLSQGGFFSPKPAFGGASVGTSIGQRYA